ncbi:MAG: hypothetical protein F4146_00230 [Rhodothermaceae bacterium]|nr:hypothetical protein [Bacteroidota bacterium]MDE2671466.1 hypothetical protein [Bacteroidota bacterium]MXZ04800.1 hypothetical protein [Rhodothermaceae bacterium]MYF39550.1 hypothetical protein [Rhodothermaceae bacterium]MYH07010.1 hypothetical protein [Rhodothermaceae bacterium]
MYGIGHPLTSGGPNMVADTVSYREDINAFVKTNTAPFIRRRRTITIGYIRFPQIKVLGFYPIQNRVRADQVGGIAST